MTNEEFIESIRLEGEEWRNVVGWKNIYMVSNYGRIVRVTRHVRNNSPSGRTLPAMLLKPKLTKNGYLSTTFYNNGYKKDVLLHRLVAEAFLPNPNSLPTVDHIDRNRTNNHVSNLRWCTLSENMNNPNTIMHCRNINLNSTHPSMYKPVVSLDKGILVKKYTSLKEAVLDGYKQDAISNTLAGRHKSHRGLQWMLLSDYESLINKSKNTIPTQD